MAQHSIDIGDAQHLFDTESGLKKVLAKEDLLRLQLLLEAKQKTRTSVEINEGSLKRPHDDIEMRDNSLDVTDKHRLTNNTAINAISSIRAGIVNTVRPVWKYVDHHKRKASVAAIVDRIWKKSSPLPLFLKLSALLPPIGSSTGGRNSVPILTL